MFGSNWQDHDGIFTAKEFVEVCELLGEDDWSGHPWRIFLCLNQTV